MHTAGLVTAGTQLPGDSRDAFVAATKAAPIESPPGARYRYTNAGYSLLAAIVEVASGMTFEDYLRQHIFTPAGMRSAVFRIEVPAADTLFARGYVSSSSGPVPGPPNPYNWGRSEPGASGQPLATSIDGWSRWSEAKSCPGSTAHYSSRHPRRHPKRRTGGMFTLQLTPLARVSTRVAVPTTSPVS